MGDLTYSVCIHVFSLVGLTSEAQNKKAQPHIKAVNFTWRGWDGHCQSDDPSVSGLIVVHQ